MSISKAEVLATVNERLKRKETDIEDELRQALKTISGAGKFLAASASDTISAGESNIDYPQDCMCIKAIFIDDSDYEMNRMRYPRKDEGNLDTGKPVEYEEFEGKIRFDKKSDGSYDLRIDYWKYHPESLTTILLPDEFREAIYALTTANVAYMYGITDRGQFWETKYYQQLDMLKNHNEKKGVRFIRYNNY